MDVIHDQNMEKNLSLIYKEIDIFGFLFIGDGATISKITTIDHIGFRKNLPVAALELVDCQGHLIDGG